MKNVLKIDFDKRAIVMDRTFAKNAQNTRSEEYAQLQKVRQDYPGFSVKRRSIKKNANKKTYKGLTYEFMVKYIVTHESPENLKAVLDEFNSLREIGSVCGSGRAYPVMKQWFLERYPEFENFGAVIEVEEFAPIYEIEKKRA